MTIENINFFPLDIALDLRSISHRLKFKCFFIYMLSWWGNQMVKILYIMWNLRYFIKLLLPFFNSSTWY